MKNEKLKSGTYRRFFTRSKTVCPFFIFHFSFFILFGLSSCDNPKVIPNDELAQIFHDIYLTNAYTDTHRPANLDSLNIYEPIFARYGYTSEDIQFTIGSFSKRKSARLSDDVVDKALDMLHAESAFYARRIAIADTIDRIAREKFATVAYTDTLIRVRRIADTARLRITIPVKAGSYEVTYSYLVDSVDLNTNLRANIYLTDERNARSGNYTRRLRHREREKVSTNFTAGNNHRELVLNLNGYSEEMTAPSMRIDTLVVRYFLPDAVARDSMARGLFDYRMLDSLSRLHETHLVPPFADTLGTASR